MKTDVQNEILNGSIFAGILKMALPLMLLNLINTGYALVDTFFVGKISELAVGAVSLVAPIIGCGNASELLIKEALIYAYYSIFTSFCMGWFNNLMAVYNGSGNTLISMILSACRLFAVRIPVIWLLARFTNLQHIGIWVAMIISNLIICISGQIIYRHYPWDSRGVRI